MSKKFVELTNVFKERSCPNCGKPTSPDTAVVSRAKTPAEESTFEVVKESFIGFRKGQLFFTFRRCARCSLCYSDRFFDSSQLNELYRSMPDNSAGEDIATLSRTQSKYVSVLKRETEIGDRWLDVGADIGLLGYALRHQGAKRIDAIEPNVEVHSQLSNNIGSNGVVGVDWASFVGNQYEGIAAIHVLDHFEALSEELHRIYKHLVPGGHFFAVVHNERSLLRYLLGTRWPPFCLQHPQLFSKSTLQKTLENHGFTVVVVGRTTNYFSLKHLVTVGSKVLGLSSRLGKIAPGFVIPFKFGNIFVIGQKPL